MTPTTLTPGTRLGLFEILSSLGEGGMGAVYRARDTKLGRDVAIKVLLPAVANDPDRVARFSREAQVLASLNHPHIAAIYGIEDADGTKALVLELVEGPTLADRIAQGPIPLDEALPIAKQIAAALEAAHEQGIIHRDLKPANIKVRPDGTVKVLDFGLAKPSDLAGALSSSLSNSPTMTSFAVTAAGVVLGTAAYMSPEQARGKPVDSGADIWAFGVVLWEMLTGRRLFDGQHASDVLAAVLRDDPDWQALPVGVPPGVARLLRRCLRRDVTRRLQHIGDARIELEEVFDEPVAARPAAALSAPRSSRVERTWPLTTDVCRQLTRETLNTAVIGDSLHYADNQRQSDVLVVFVPGFGFGHGVFGESLDSSPWRAVAVSLYGFEEHRGRRIPLPIADHMTILRLFLKSIRAAANAQTTILCGFSSGADVVLRMIADGGLSRDEIDGILGLGPNVSLQTCFFSRRVADVGDHKDAEILDIARAVSTAMQTPQAWLHMTPYLMELVRKYHTDIDALRLHGRDIIQPFLDGPDNPLAAWYRASRSKGIPVRLVFAGAEDDEQSALRELMLAHVDRQVFGPDFDDGDLVSEADVQHMELMRPGLIEHQMAAFLTRLRQS